MLALMVSPNDRLSPDYWSQRAEEAQTRADGMHDPAARQAMLTIAMMCSQMSLRAEIRKANQPPEAMP